MSTQIIRCPICLLSQPVKTGVSANKILHCGNCKRDFAVKNGLPLKEGETIAYATEPSSSTTALKSGISTIEPVTTRNVAITWIFGAIIWLIVGRASRSYIAPLNGPDFLFFYFFLFIGIWLSTAVMRKIWEDSMHVTLIALLLFEGIGLIRFFDASAAGMHKFNFMFIMMAIGAVLLFSRYDHSGSSNWSDSSGCSSSCSGCGGGGGCGGCGD